jgi:hypothetical protein
MNARGAARLCMGASLAAIAVLVLGAPVTGAADRGTPAGHALQVFEDETPATIPTSVQTAAPAQGIRPPDVPDALTNLRVNDPSQTPAGSTDMTPVVATIGDKVLVVWFVRGTTTTQRMRAAISEDGGATFTDVGWLPAIPGSPGTWRWGADPCVAADPVTGTFFVAAQATNSPFAQGVAFVTATIGGGITWGTPSILFTGSNTGVFLIDQIELHYDPPSQTLHLVFHDGFSIPMLSTYRLSLDRGATWQPPVTISATDDQGVYPRVTFNYLGTMVLYQNFSDWDLATLRSARYLGNGTFDTPHTLASYRFSDTALPGTIGEGYLGLSLASDRTFYRFGQRIYAAWIGETGFFVPPVPNGAMYAESEPNNTPAQANTMPSDMAYFGGNVSSPTDSDCVRVPLNAGQSLIVRLYSYTVPTGANPGVYAGIVAPDGVHSLGWSFLPVPDGNIAQANLMFTAPVAGTYVLKLVGFNVPHYQVSLAFAQGGTYPGYDRRDIYASFSTDMGNTWSGPSVLYSSLPGYDVANVKLTVGNDGRPYLFWHDFSEGNPYGGVGSLRCTRSSDGGLTWETPRTLSTAYSDWQAVVPVGTSFKIGWKIGAATTPPATDELVQAPAPAAHAPAASAASEFPEERMQAVWTDARDGNTNIYTTSFPTGFSVLHVTNDTTAVPGQFLALRAVLQNRNTVFPLRLDPETPVCQRANWQVSQATFSLDPGTTSSLYPILVMVPDTAAAGTVFFQGGFNLGPTSFGMNVFIHVETPGVGVPGAQSEPALEFAAPMPNPASSDVSFRYTLPIPEKATLELFDLRGARVRTLQDGPSPVGVSTRTWDLRDDAGHRVAPGVYLSRLQVGKATRVRRVAVLP